METVILNYMALHGEIGNFNTAFPNQGIGDNKMLDRMTAFQPIVTGTTKFPVP